VFDLQHRFAYANAVRLRMWNRTWIDAIGKTCLELGYPVWHAGAVRHRSVGPPPIARAAGRRQP
jgi:hypothetical protein